jgi:hypothetical protein
MTPLRVFHDAPPKYYSTSQLMWLKSGNEQHLVQMWKSSKKREQDMWVLVPTVKGEKNES